MPGIIEETACKLLQSTDPHFPIKPSMIAKKHGIRVRTYFDYAHATGVDVIDVWQRHGPDGFTLYLNGAYGIFYNPRNIPRTRWTITHELAHIFLGHLRNGQCSAPHKWEEKDWTDVQADSVAATVLCPEAVMHFCQIESQEELKELCDLSKQASGYRWSSLCKRRMRDGFSYISPHEKLILEHFQDFIARYVKEKVEHEPQLDPYMFPQLRYRI